MLGVCNRQLSRRAESEEIKSCEVMAWQEKRINASAVEIVNGIQMRSVVMETVHLERIFVGNIKLVMNGKEIQMEVNKEKLKELDSHWSEVMELAEKYGFIGQAFGGTAVLLTHKNQLEADGEEKYIRRQKDLFGLDMKTGGNLDEQN